MIQEECRVKKQGLITVVVIVLIICAGLAAWRFTGFYDVLFTQKDVNGEAVEGSEPTSAQTQQERDEDRDSTSQVIPVQTGQASDVQAGADSTTTGPITVAQTSAAIRQETAESITVRAQKEMWDTLHKMANTKIVADQIWGETEITPERVDRLLEEVEQSAYPDKIRLLDMLNRWKDGDFSQAVEEHNYLWEKLDGTVGKATGLRK